jgi:hypothetical protein
VDLELDEVLVQGKRQKPKRPTFAEYQAPFDFMARLVGTFVVDGVVDLHAEGRAEDLRAVTGRIECVGFGVAPGVTCELHARWAETTGPDGGEMLGGVSTLIPAVLLYGFDTRSPEMDRRASMNAMTAAILGRTNAYAAEQPGISYVMVDSKGVAETATGQMTSPDTMRSRSKCLAIAGNCERVVRITASPDLKTVAMNIDLLIDERKAVRFAFVMHRVPGTDSIVFGRKPAKAGKKK